MFPIFIFSFFDFYTIVNVNRRESHVVVVGKLSYRFLPICLFSFINEREKEEVDTKMIGIAKRKEE